MKFWEEKEISNWGEFENIISGFNYREWLFRGHSDLNWKLESSYYRLSKRIEKIFKDSPKKTPNLFRNRHEKQIIANFKAQAHLYLKHLPPLNNDLEWLTIMQHYGTPTRLLDVTFSPYVALFFALEFADDASCVFAIKYKYFKDIDENALDKNYKNNIFKEQKDEKSFFIAYEPDMKNERVVAQQGAFLISSTNYQTYDQIFEHYEIKSKVGFKIIIAPAFRYEGLKKLRTMNISSASLFPGLEGFCKSLRFQLLDGIRETIRLH